MFSISKNIDYILKMMKLIKIHLFKFNIFIISRSFYNNFEKIAKVISVILKL